MSTYIVNAFNVTVCDCDSAERQGFVKFSEDDCKYHPNSSPPIPVYYRALSTLPVMTRFSGYTCSMWEIIITVERDFFGWDKVERTRIPMETTAAECQKMRDLRQCRGKAMEVLGQNKWALEGPPHVQGSWLRTTAGSLVNCHLEEVTLESECANCTISSPLGDIPAGANGSFSHNLITIIWDAKTLKQEQQCKIRLVEEGQALLYNTTDPLVQRIRDSQQQLDFLFNVTDIGFCKTISAKSARHKAVLGMNGVVLRLEYLTKGSDPKTRQPQPDVERITDIGRAEIDAAAHSQFIRDRAVEMSNEVAKEVRSIQCQSRELAHRNAITTAQYNGWLAASYLELPLCSRLTAVGTDVAILQCKPINVTFTPEFTSCGPQPRYLNHTISAEGWELTRYSECYWYSNFVNFNGRAHAFKNGTWTPIQPSVVVQGQKLINTQPIEVDNALGTLLRLHPALRSNPMSPAAAMADILASVQQHHAIDFTGDRHLSNILINHQDAPNISFMARIGGWLRNFGMISGIGVTIALAFRFCALGTLISKFVPGCAWLQLVNPFNWLANNERPSNPPNQDAELGHQTVTDAHPAHQLTIINAPQASEHMPSLMTTAHRESNHWNLPAEEILRIHKEAALAFQHSQV